MIESNATVLNERTFLLTTKKMAVSLSVEEVQTVLLLIAEERIQWELDGAMQNEKVFQESRQ